MKCRNLFLLFRQCIVRVPSSMIPLPSQTSSSSFLLFTHPSSSNHPSFSLRSSFHKREGTRSFIISRFILLITTPIGFISIKRKENGIEFWSTISSTSSPSSSPSLVHLQSSITFLYSDRPLLSPFFFFLRIWCTTMIGERERGRKKKGENGKRRPTRERWGWVMVGELSWEWEESYWWRERGNHISSLP